MIAVLLILLFTYLYYVGWFAMATWIIGTAIGGIIIIGRFYFNVANNMDSLIARVLSTLGIAFVVFVTWLFIASYFL